MKKSVWIVAILVLSSTSVLTLTLLPDVRAATLYVGGGGPGNYTMIQEAIDDAYPGDTIYVYAGDYPGNVVVNKTVSLIGEDRVNTRIIGFQHGDAVRVSADWVNITNLNVSNGGMDPEDAVIGLRSVRHCRVANNNVSISLVHGIALSFSENNIVAGNNVSHTSFGVVAHFSGNNTISSNNVSLSAIGILVRYSTNNTITNNVFLKDGIHIDGDELEHWNTHTIDTGNTVNGKPVYYWKNVTGGTIPSGAGEVILANCTGVLVENQNVSLGTVGIELGFSSGNTINGNIAFWNYVSGIFLHHSSNNTVSNNSVLENGGNGILVLSSDRNTVIDNIVSLNRGNGIRLKSSDDNSIVGNNAPNNGNGINLKWSDNNTITANTPSPGNVEGISLLYSNNNTVSSNVASNNYHGIRLHYSAVNIVANNTADLNHDDGLGLFRSHNNTLTGNEMVRDGIYVYGGELEHWNTHTIDTSNTVNGKPVYYWKNVTGGTIPSGAGEVILANCTGVLVENQNVSLGTVGIELGFSSGNTIRNNTASGNNYKGIELDHSSDNTILDNTASSNAQYGIYLFRSNGSLILNNTVQRNGVGFNLFLSRTNRVYHNRIMNNTRQAEDNTDANMWDDGYPSGGNYWSDYGGVDEKRGPNQDQPGNDGIGDTPYVIDTDSRDRYPLMYPFEVFLRPPRILEATLTGWNLENVTITWSLSPDDDGGLGSVTRYETLRNTTYHPEGFGYELIATLPNGTSILIDNQRGEGDPNNYFYLICAVDVFNYTACAKDQGAKFTRPLSPGPNLISIPLVQSDESIETVLQTVQYDKAWYYDSSSQEWKWYMKHKGYRRGLLKMNHTMGIWLNVTEDSNLTLAGIVPAQTTIHLYKGWNLVSFPSFNTSYSVSDLKGEIGARRVEGYDSAPPNFLRVVEDADVLQAGFGYWVRVEAVTNWIVEVS